jgi:DNA-binding response OmpR family regulator
MTYLAAAASYRHAGEPARVLVVDDSDQLVGLVGAWLEDEGYLVATATTGATAMAAVSAESPDIVVLDLILPPPDGFTLCRLFSAMRRPPAVVVMTGIGDLPRLRQLDGLGIVAVLQKPLTQEMLLDAVSRARRRRWEGSAAAHVT